MLNPKPSEEARHIARSVAHWLVLMESGSATAKDYAALQDWRADNAAHEQAWQKAQALRNRFDGLPKRLAMASLDRPTYDRRRLLKGMLGITLVAPSAWIISRQLPLEAWQADLSTGTGERQRISLAGGNILELNTATAVNLDAAQSYLQLIRGEIALQVISSKPFVIDTSCGQALISRGELCVRQQEDAVEFSVLAGFSTLHPKNHPSLVLQAGQRIRLTPQQVGPIQGFDIQQPGWREGVIVAHNQPLGDFLREVDRYRLGILRWSASLESLRVTGTFRLDNTDQILTLLAASLPLEVQSRTRYWVTLIPREKNA